MDDRFTGTAPSRHSALILPGAPLRDKGERQKHATVFQRHPGQETGSAGTVESRRLACSEQSRTLIPWWVLGHKSRDAHGTQEHELLEHSTSSGLSQGIQMGIGFNDRQGAGNSMVLHVPGIQTDALPRLTQGRI